MQATAKTLATFAVMVVASAVLPARAGTVTSDAAVEAAKGWVNLREAPGAPFDVAVVADGAAATITGLPAFAVSDGSSLHGWQLRILDGGKRLRVCRKGVTVIVY